MDPGLAYVLLSSTSASRDLNKEISRACRGFGGYRGKRPGGLLTGDFACAAAGKGERMGPKQRQLSS